jgi:hypothetical protein
LTPKPYGKTIALEKIRQVGRRGREGPAGAKISQTQLQKIPISPSPASFAFETNSNF